LAEKWTQKLAKHPEAPPLRPVQGYILEACHRAAQLPTIGVLGNVGVGKGKTLGFLNAPAVFGAKRAVLLIPPEMREQYEADRWEWGQHYHLDNVEVVAYSMLSRPEGTDLLRRLAPDLIMADECQALRYATAARTKRFIRYMKENPGTRFMAMSGTLSTSSLEDYAHLAEIACRQFSPLPTSDSAIKRWASVLDAEGEPDDLAWRDLQELVQHFGNRQWVAPSASRARPMDLKAARTAFQERFRTAPYCVGTVSASSDADLTLSAVRPPLSDAVKNALALLQQDYMLPNGDPVVDAFHFTRAATQLSMGFYYVWDWPNEPDEDWVEARKQWASAVRWYLKHYSREGCDSPFLVEEHVRACLKAGRSVAPTLVDALQEWDQQRHKDPPPVKAVWIDTSPVMYAWTWAQRRKEGFIWFRSRAVGELLQALGIPTFWEGTPSHKSTPIAALSISVYHKGRNFQAWNDQLIMEPMPNAATWEQLLGRQHRAGQSRGVSADVYQHTWPLMQAMRKALRRAKYIEHSQGQPQKLLFAQKTGFSSAFAKSPGP